MGDEVVKLGDGLVGGVEAPVADGFGVHDPQAGVEQLQVADQLGRAVLETGARHRGPRVVVGEEGVGLQAGHAAKGAGPQLDVDAVGAQFGQQVIDVKAGEVVGVPPAAGEARGRVHLVLHHEPIDAVAALAVGLEETPQVGGVGPADFGAFAQGAIRRVGHLAADLHPGRRRPG